MSQFGQVMCAIYLIKILVLILAEGAMDLTRDIALNALTTPTETNVAHVSASPAGLTSCARCMKGPVTQDVMDVTDPATKIVISVR